VDSEDVVSADSAVGMENSIMVHVDITVVVAAQDIMGRLKNEKLMHVKM
jgi:hypothetical protein